MSELQEAATTYTVDDRGLFCRHCGKASWLHHRVRGLGNLCNPTLATTPARNTSQIGEG